MSSYEFEGHFPEFPIVVADDLGVVDRFATVAGAMEAYPTAVPFKGAGDRGFTYWDTRDDCPLCKRLEELRAQLRAERISYGELAELEGLAKHIAADDVELLEAAGVPEKSGCERAE